MTQKFTVEEVRACLAEFSDDVAFPREEIDIEKVRTMLTAFADTLSKPADSGRVSESMVCRMFEVMNAHFESEFQSLNKLSDEDEATAKRGIRAGLAALAAQGQGDGEPAAWRIHTDDDVERVAKAAGWDNRRYMTPADYAIWCVRMREFVRLAVTHPAPAASPGEAVAWPTRLANHPVNDGSGDRIVGFRVSDGDPILGEYGLSEPLDWLRKNTVDRHPAPPASPAGVPDGMVLVPWEPTPVMLAIYEHIRSGSDWQAHVFRLTKRQLNRHRAAYKAMIAAAPSAPEGDGGAE